MNSCERNCRGNALFISFLVGTLAGATAVFLLAPKSRKESAERIGEFSRDLKERATGAVDTAKEAVSSFVSRGKEMVEEKRSILASAVEAGKEAYVKGTARAERGD